MTAVTPEDYTGPSHFVHLHNHTVYSALDGCATAEQYAERCHEWGLPAMSATEHGHMASVPDMYFAFKKYGLKYIAGCEIYYNDWEPKRQLLEKKGVPYRTAEWRSKNIEAAARMFRNRHLTILCKNEIGLQNLIKLTTQAYATGLFGLGRTQFNRIWFDKLCEFKEGLIVLSGCLNGPASFEMRTLQFAGKALKDKKPKKEQDDGQEADDKPKMVFVERPKGEGLRAAVEYIKKFRKVFKEDFCMELQMPGIPGSEVALPDDYVFRKSIEIADALRIPVVLANDVHYMDRKDFALQKLMMAVAQNTTVDDPELFHVNSDEQYMKSRAELWARFKNHYSNGIDDRKFEEMCDNTLMVADKCKHLNMDTAPKIPEIVDADTKLRELVARRLRALRLDECRDKFLIDGRMVTYVEQAKIELNRFIDKGFSSYFYITRDLVQYGKQRGWPFSPRGSAGGSLVCYLLDIHVLDPLKWGLSFDRFLSPSCGGYMLNVTMPDPVTGR